MNLTVPYTFYPLVLPHWIAWMLFMLAIAGGVFVGLAQGSQHGPVRGLVAGIVGTVGSLFATMIASMVITFFVTRTNETRMQSNRRASRLGSLCQRRFRC
jgi:hypothetical protein